MDKEERLRKLKRKMIIQICLFVLLSTTIYITVIEPINSQNKYNNASKSKYNCEFIQRHNSLFINYQGVQTGSDARFLCHTIAEVNRDYEEEGVDFSVKLSINGEPTIIPKMSYDNEANNILNDTTNQMTEKSEYSDVKNKLLSSKRYEVWFEYEQENIITTIHINKIDNKDNSEKGGK